MAPIIRKPALSEQKHALRSKLGAQTSVEPKSVAALLAEPVVTAPISPLVAPAIDERAIEREVQRRLADLERKLESELQSLVQQDLEARHKAAAESGYAEGMKRAEASLTEATMAKRQQVEQVLANVAHAYHSDVERIEAEAAAIAYEAVCKIVGSQLIGAEAVLAIVAQSTSHLRQNQRLTIRLAPHDHALLLGILDEKESSAHQWVADERIKLGGCVIETELGELDARLETQLESLRDVLLSVKTGLPAP